MCGTCRLRRHEGDSRTIMLQQKVLAKNDELAERNRAFLADRGAVMVNLIARRAPGKLLCSKNCARASDRASPGQCYRRRSGDRAGRRPDQGGRLQRRADQYRRRLSSGRRDGRGGAERARSAARRRGRSSRTWATWSAPRCSTSASPRGSCSRRVTEGGDKPLKYPHMFRQADLVLVTKIDLLPYVDFDLEQYAADVRRLSPPGRAADRVGREPARAWPPGATGSRPAPFQPVAGGRYRGLAQADPAVVARNPADGSARVNRRLPAGRRRC